MSETRQDPSVALLLGIVRAIPAIALAGLFTWMAFYIRGWGGRPVDWGGPALIALLCGLGAVFTIVRAMLKSSGPPSKTKGKGSPTVEEEPAFDADAAIQRYLNRRGAEPGPIPAEAGAPERAAPRPVFGRKTSS